MEPHQISLLGTGAPALDPDAVVARTWLDEHAWVDFAAGWLRGADTLLAELVESLPWQQGRRWMYDRMVDDPRLTFMSRRGGRARHPALTAARAALESRYGVRLSGPGFNYYRNGRDSVAPHSDRELRELDDTIVAILTLGARRPFLLKAKAGGPSRDLAPGSGDRLVLGGATQLGWEHAVPKISYSGPRVSVSWRWSSASRRSPGTLEP
ncbi:MAG: alpha-ketoglutarate-dependent dioxygenase AlkB [Acidimicrobiia bacterium]